MSSVVYYKEYSNSQWLIHTLKKTFNKTNGSPFLISECIISNGVDGKKSPFNYILKKLNDDEGLMTKNGKTIYILCLDCKPQMISKSSYFTIEILETINLNTYKIIIWSACHQIQNKVYEGIIEVEVDHFFEI